MNTGTGTSPTGVCRGVGDRRYSRRWGDCGGIALGEIFNVYDRVMDAANHHGMYVPM